jgi:hypothetical protein
MASLKQYFAAAIKKRPHLPMAFSNLPICARRPIGVLPSDARRMQHP